jgi:hypothetical protein
LAAPLLLLDVDGVLNPFPDCPAGFSEHDLFPDDSEPVRLAVAHRGWLQELAGMYEIVWASAWGHDANRLLCPFYGIPECALVEFPPTPFSPREKLPAVARFVGDRPAAWIDDEVTDDAEQWAADRPSPTLLIQVEPRAGLRRCHVDRLLSWAGRVS